MTTFTSAAAENSTIRIGSSQTRAFIRGIPALTTGGTGTTVLVDANGQLGTISSSRRFKYDLEDMNQATKKLLRLRPVTFRYKQAQNDGSHPLQYGLIAEEVADVYPDLVQYDSKTGEPNTALYHVLPAMLLNEFQKTAQTGGGATGRDPITAGRTGSVGGANPAVADRDDGAQSRENRTAKSLPFSAPISRVR